MEFRHKSPASGWVCPNDRQLALRAKLQTGWSVKSNTAHSTRRNSPLDEGEKNIIVNVIQKAESLEKNERLRVGRLVERLENMKKHALGNGVSTCVLCGEKFGLLTGAKHVRCHDCDKAVCSKCAVETDSTAGPSLHLCKICSESRELWKKSGAWFFSSLPPYQLPVRSRPSAGAPGGARAEAADGSGMARSLMRYKWVRNISQSCGESVNSVASARLDRHPCATSSADLSAQAAPFRRRGSCSSEEEQCPAGCSAVRRITTYDRASSVTVSGPLKNREKQHNWKRSAPNLVHLQSSKPQSSLDDSDRKSVSYHPTVLPTFSRSCPRIRIGSSSSTNSQEGSTSDLSSDCSTGVTGSADLVKVLPTSIEFSVHMDLQRHTLSCHIHRVTDIWPVYRGLAADSYVKLHLHPATHKTNKLRTRLVSGTLCPVFDETLVYHNVTEHVVNSSKLQLTLMDEDRFGHDVLGECLVTLSKLPDNQHERFCCPLLPIRAGRLGRCAGVYRGQLLLSLKYITCRQLLVVGVVRCSALTCVDPTGRVDAFAKVQLRPGRHKFCTSVKWRCTTAEFNEEFHVPCQRKQLAKSVLDVRVYDKDIGSSNELLGHLQFSVESRGERLRHWFDALQYPDRRHDRWHPLSTDQPAQLPV